MNAYQFFMKHAGYSYGNGETKMQGRIRCARQLAKDEAAARRYGFTYAWDIDPDINSSDFDDTRPPYRLWQCCMLNPEGRIVGSLHGIDFGPDGTPWANPYRRVEEAELAYDVLTNAPQGKYRGINR